MHDNVYPKNWRFFRYIILILLCGACNKTPQKQGLSFCYWKTSFYLDSKEDSLFASLGGNHFYIRFFDVDWNAYEKQALPVATLGSYSRLPNEATTFTPAVFITNRVMEQCDSVMLDTLAVRISSRVESILARFRKDYCENQEYRMRDCKEHFNLDSLNKISAEQFNKRIAGILIDCDWSERSKEKYFYFLERFKKLYPAISLSVTLRLWQYKYREKAGIPNADRCLLMCYSMESPTDYKVENSIGSIKELKKYVINKKYPLELDVALPLFHWAVMFHEGQFKGLLNNINPLVYENDTLNFYRIAPNRYKLRNSLVIGNKYFRYGDEVRIEQVSPMELGKMANFIKDNFKIKENSRLTFFAWDTAYIKNYGIENIKKYTTDFYH